MTSTKWIPLLVGTVGSHAYGLATPESDVDTLGVSAAPTEDILGLHPPRDKTASRVRTNPDVTVHEIGKYLALALKANPTVTELLWLPESSYSSLSHRVFKAELIDLRKTLLGADAVRNAYLGYATSQFQKLLHRGALGTFSSDTKNRTAKHARHLMRLLTQGVQLYTTGEMTVRLENPQEYHDFGELVATDLGRGVVMAQEKLISAGRIFDEYASALPGEADSRIAESWLIHVRKHFLANGAEGS